MPGPGRPFQPGQSGNLNGRPRGHAKALARKHTPEAIEALVAALQCPKERVAAAVALLDRGWGRPTQPVEADLDLQQGWVVCAPTEVADAAD